MSKYNIVYFIAKFEAIPEDRWCTGKFVNNEGQMCALGHCRSTNDPYTTITKEAIALMQLLPMSITDLNDNQFSRWGHYGATPKARVLAALHAELETA